MFSHNPLVLRGALQERELLDKLFRILFRVIHEIPTSSEKETIEARARSRKLISEASFKAAAISGALALPSGPLGWLTILPDLAAIWRLQAQMVADLAGVYGKSAALTAEHMVYCLFRHTAAQLLRDVAVRVAQRSAGSGIARWLPAIGAVGVGAYAFYDTSQVASRAIGLFGSDSEGRVA